MKKLVLTILIVAGLGAGAAVADLLGFADIGHMFAERRVEFAAEYRKAKANRLPQPPCLAEVYPAPFLQGLKLFLAALGGAKLEQGRAAENELARLDRATRAALVLTTCLPMRSTPNSNGAACIEMRRNP